MVVEVWERDGGGGVGRRRWWRCGKKTVVVGDGGGGVGERRWWRRGKETVMKVWERDSEYMLVSKKIE